MYLLIMNLKDCFWFIVGYFLKGVIISFKPAANLVFPMEILFEEQKNNERGKSFSPTNYEDKYLENEGIDTNCIKDYERCF